MKKIIFLTLLSLTIQKIKIIQPPSLINKFKSSSINYSISTFGEILFTDKTIVQLLIPEKNNIFGCKSFKQPSNKILNTFVWLVERGKCTYSKKASNAQESGAYSIIVYHDDKDAMIGNIVAIEDKLFNDIKIPIILIKNQDGETFIDFFNNLKNKNVDKENIKKDEDKKKDNNINKDNNIDKDFNKNNYNNDLKNFKNNNSEVILYIDIDNVI